MIVIGEKINATRTRVKRAIEERDADHLMGLVTEQVAAGADYVDLNAGTGTGSTEREIDDMKWLIDMALEAADKPLCIDSADPAVLRASAEHLRGRRSWMFNSIKGERDALEVCLDVVEEHDVPFIALAMDGDGIARDVEGRLRACDKILEVVQERGIPAERVFFDPLVMPLVTDVTQALVTCDCIRAIGQRFERCRTVVGLSNVSHCLPRRGLLNQGFLTAALMSGLDAAILDPTDRTVQVGLVVGEALAGKDRNCRRYARAHRKCPLGAATEGKSG